MTEQNSPRWAGSTADWHARRVHNIELPSGMPISFRFPTLGELIASGQLPETLLELAVAEWAEPGATAGRIHDIYATLPDEPAAEQQVEADGKARELGDQVLQLHREICAAALVAPAMTAEQLAHPDVPVEDIEYLAGILNRTIGFDAAGRRIGVEPLDTFRVVAAEHGCDPGCPQCEKARARLSSVHQGPL